MKAFLLRKSCNVVKNPNSYKSFLAKDLSPN